MSYAPDFSTSRYGAELVQTLAVAAVVAHEAAVEAVVGQADAAVGAAVGKTAVHAGYELVRAPAVQIQDTLLPALYIRGQLFAQALAHAAAVAAAKLALHVNDLDRGHGPLIEAARQGEEGVVLSSLQDSS